MISGEVPRFIEAALGLLVGAFVTSTVLCGLACRYAERLGFLDRPGGHKGHKAPIPLGGGLAIWLTTVSILFAGLLILTLGKGLLPEALARHAGGAIMRSGKLAWILAMATVVMIMGFWDDRRPLDWRVRLGIQILCSAVLAAIADVRVTLFWPFTNPWLGGVVTVLWIVGLTNSFNMLDNMDALAASVGVIAALMFCGAQLAVGSLFAPAVLLVLVGALAGFLVYNVAPARLFMGDAGSNFTGFLLGALTVAGTFTTSVYSPYSVLAPLLVMAVPLYDMTSVVLIRLREGRSPFQGDRRHFSHRLVARGLTPAQAVWTIDLVTLASGLGALLLHRLDGAGASAVLAQTCCLLGVVAILEFSANRPEELDGQAQCEIIGSTGAEDDLKAGRETRTSSLGG
jgi:UDP-GlcNAc:undecaprenyl-phosphate GlcNAc-1-phosphate transferase